MPSKVEIELQKLRYSLFFSLAGTLAFSAGLAVALVTALQREGIGGLDVFLLLGYAIMLYCLAIMFYYLWKYRRLQGK
ncbi:MAG: hypothetical protein HY519_03520 [Candidatus Aenigmarchaeota archaeon]|nr:hypothetical protein [Candidatus Aenigmarchaeota archaeon]